MKISVFGLGYVGCVSAACLAARGHEVVGVDVNPTKVELVLRGQAPVVEERIGELTADVVGSGALRATTDVEAAIGATEVSLVCVGTPSAANGSLSTTYLERVAEQIGRALAGQGHRHTVVFRSTMLPGTCLDLLVPILERASGGTAGRDFGVAVNPEFLREGTSVRDFFEPPKTVIGEYDVASGDVVAALYEGLPGEVFRVPIPVAEMIKYADNAFHAVKIGFANEIGTLCAKLGIDGAEVLDTLCKDTVLNLSSAYLKPGFAFG
ncbi:MAG TPA: nucleotide sugar dehydrogenase, partial [Pseudonocardiaceae bacterium]